MKRKIKVYIAGPYTSNPEGNTNKAIDVWERLYNMGFIPFCPHLLYFIDDKHSHSYKELLEYDMEWLRACDCIFRFPGESKGADEETALAKKLGMIVFTTYEGIYNYYYDHSEED